MKKTVMILFCLSTMPFLLIAQNTVKQKEAGIVFNNLNNLKDIGLTYKTGTNKSMWRFTTLFLSGGIANQTDQIPGRYNADHKTHNFGFGLKFGKEYRKPFANNFELRYGADLSFSYSRSTINRHITDDLVVYHSSVEESWEQMAPGVNLVFGVNYVIKKVFVIGAEILPGLKYTTTTSTLKSYDTYTLQSEKKTKSSGFSIYGFSSNSIFSAVKITLAYRFK